ncbi:hypothetical protein FRC08_003311 [Ceratobasidium sp. 394]|nr:hypothetical protein FRC08_003311 [Ceratobasidium sp. 394]KAG9096270.1 hypothetical protein FS749_008803 [Ceratobasidium sp. UAMH 11750]
MPIRQKIKSFLSSQTSIGASSNNSSHSNLPPPSPNPSTQTSPLPSSSPSPAPPQHQTPPGGASTITTSLQPVASSSSGPVAPSSSPSALPPQENELKALAPLRTQCDVPFATIAAELAPIPGISALVECLDTVFQAVGRSRVNTEQWKLLQGRCVMVARMAGAQVTNYGGQSYNGVQEASKLLHDTMSLIGQRIEYWNRMDGVIAFMNSAKISEEIASYFYDLDKCLVHFSYAVDVAHVQWIDEFTAVQKAELAELNKLRLLLVDVKTDLTGIGQNQDELVTMTTDIRDMLRQTLVAKSTILQNPASTTPDDYADTEQIVRTIRAVTGMELPLELLVGRQCITEGKRPLKQGTTCDVWLASFLGGGVKVAKKVFRVGSAERENIEKYAQRFLRDAKLWSTFRSDYTLPFHGIGMEELDDGGFQLYMVSPLMKNLDAVTYLKTHRSDPSIQSDILRIITDAARGLQYLHDKDPPVVHSGMQGSNILITDTGGGVLGGFGLTKALQHKIPGEKLPTAIMTGMTEAQRYMAPEMLGEENPELRTPCDIWGWGMAALEIISGNMPYYHSRWAQLVATEIQKKKLPIRAKYPKFEEYALKPDPMWALLERCWAYEPGDRPTIDEVVVVLKGMARS